MSHIYVLHQGFVVSSAYFDFELAVRVARRTVGNRKRNIPFGALLLGETLTIEGPKGVITVSCTELV